MCTAGAIALSAGCSADSSNSSQTGSLSRLVSRAKTLFIEKTGLGGKTILTGPVRYVRFQAVTEVNGGPWSSVAEFNLIDASGALVSRDTWKVTADSSAQSDPPSSAIDGDRDSMWHTRWENAAPVPPHNLVIDLGKQVDLSGFRYLPRQDKSRNGSVARYKFYVSDDGVNWGNAVEEGNLANPAAPTAERIILFGRQPVNHPPVITPLTAQSSRQNQPVSLGVQAQDDDGDGLVYSATGLPAGLNIDKGTGVISGKPESAGQFKPTVVIEDVNGARASSAFEWTVAAPPPPPADAVQYVRLEAVSEINGGPWTAIAEFNLLDGGGAVIPRSGWKVSADSFEATDQPKSAIDGDSSSMWHTRWNGYAPSGPHHFTVDLGELLVVSGFRVLPRQDETRNGTIAAYRFYVSKDGKDWGTPVVQGDFGSLGASNTEKTVYLK